MSDEKVKEVFTQKTWNEIKANDSWAIFKIMSEFVSGYEKMSKIGPSVSILAPHVPKLIASIISLPKKSLTNLPSQDTE